jgi:hypothetical protein
MCPASDDAIEVIHMHGHPWKASALLLTLVLAACEAPKPAGDATADTGSKPASAPQQPVSGKTAFWAMYKTAYSWAPDLVPLGLESKSVPGIKNGAGKAAMWTATFGSASRREARAFSYSVAASPPNIYKGVTVSSSLPWYGPTPAALSFTTSDFAVDSDAAYTSAASQAAAWTKSHPGQDVSFTLGNAARFNGPVWYVLWGEKKGGYSVLVDAKSGAIVK